MNSQMEETFMNANRYLFPKYFLGLIIIISNLINTLIYAQDSEDAFISDLISQMSVQEKLGQLNQYRWVWSPDQEAEREMFRQHIREGRVGSFLGIYGVELTRELQRIAIEESRLGIPLLFAFDVIHGWRTIFPVPLAAASTWNPALLEKSAATAALEAASQGVHWTFAPMIDISRDPRWGRIVEGSGEDPYLGAVLAAAYVRGFQGNDLKATNSILACAKHFCAYGGAEGGRDYNSVDISELTLREIYLTPFRAAVAAGVATCMASFNDINGLPMHANPHLINELLRTEWGFSGFMVSDYTGINELIQHGVAGNRTEAGILALTSGIDMDMDSRIYINDLPVIFKNKRISGEILDEAVRRILKAKQKLGLFEEAFRYHDLQREQNNMLTDDHRSLARQIARESIVLLKNNHNLLPLSNSLKSLAVIGALAIDKKAPLGSWHGIGKEEDVVSIFEGLRRMAPSAMTISYAPGYSLPDFSDQDGFSAALTKAQNAEAVILVLGETAHMSGEASSRSRIELPGEQEKLAAQIMGTGKPVIVILMNGRPLAIPWLAENSSALLETWFLGTEMGHAVAEVLFGQFNPCGKLPVTFPRATGQIPIYYNHKNTGRPPAENNHFTSKYLDVSWTPQFPFGYGLSYTIFEYHEPKLSSQKITFNDSLEVNIEVKNTGKYGGQEVVQLYITDEIASITPAVLKLQGFQKIFLEAGQKKNVIFKIKPKQLMFYNSELKEVIEPGTFLIAVGGDSENLKRTRFEVVPD